MNLHIYCAVNIRSILHQVHVVFGVVVKSVNKHFLIVVNVVRTDDSSRATPLSSIGNPIIPNPFDLDAGPALDSHSPTAHCPTDKVTALLRLTLQRAVTVLHYSQIISLITSCQPAGKSLWSTRFSTATVINQAALDLLPGRRPLPHHGAASCSLSSPTPALLLSSRTSRRCVRLQILGAVPPGPLIGRSVPLSQGEAGQRCGVLVFARQRGKWV